MESIFKICIRTIFLIEDKKSIKAIKKAEVLAE